MIHFCTQCGSKVHKSIPPGDDRERDVCSHCGFIHYSNPRLVVGTIPVWEDRILLAKRAIEPRYGKWTLPAGYLENGESILDGALRETREEVQAQLTDVRTFGVFNLTQISQIYYMFTGTLLNGEYGAGSESLEVELLREEEIPWDEIAFKVIRVTLERFFQDRKDGDGCSYHMENIIINRSFTKRS